MDYSPEITSLIFKRDGQRIATGVKTYQSVRNKKGTYTMGSQYNHCRFRGTDIVPPTVILTLSSSEDITINKFATILYSIIDFRPKSMAVKWLKNGQFMNSGIVTSPVCEMNGDFSVTSRLTVPGEEWFVGKAVYTYQVIHQGVNQSRNITKSPDPSPCSQMTITLLPPAIQQVLLEATVTLTCVVANAPYGVNVSWSHEKKLLKSEVAVQPAATPDSVVSSGNISTQAWLSGADFHCVVSHRDSSTPFRKSIHKEAIKLREPSLSILLPSEEEISAQRFISLSCLVRGLSPREIFVKWTVNDKLVNPGNYKNTEVKAENGNSSFFMYSLLSIAAEEWASGASYSCVVGHEAIPLKIMSRTVNKSSDSTERMRIEHYEDDNGNSQITASTFAVLFTLSMLSRC